MILNPPLKIKKKNNNDELTYKILCQHISTKFSQDMKPIKTVNNISKLF